MRKGKNKGMKLRVWATGLCMALLLTGCGSGSDYSSGTAYNSNATVSESYDTMADNGWGVMEESAAMEPDVFMEDGTAYKSEKVETPVAMEEKLIRTVDMSVETKEYDKLISGITQEVKALGGYIENMDSYNGSIYSDYRSSRNANMTLRIPKDKLDGFLLSVSELGNVTRQNEGIENVTLKYVDLASHKKALETEYDRLLVLLERAESIEDIITIESRLSNVRYQIESMESQLRTMDNKVDYSTVYLNIEEVVDYTPIEEETTLERITGGFMESLTDIAEGAKEVGIYLIVKLPYIVLWAVIIGLFLLWVIHTNKKQNKKKKEQEAQMNNVPNEQK